MNEVLQMVDAMGYTIWTILILMTGLVIFSQSGETLTKEENDTIMESLQHRENSFLMNRTKSRWGED